MEIEELISIGEEVMDFYHQISGIISGNYYKSRELELKLTKYKGWRERVLQYVYYNNFSRYSEFKEYFQKLESSPDLNAYTDIMGKLSVYYVKEKKENKIATNEHNEHKVGSNNVLIKQSSDDGFHEVSVKNSDRPINVVYNKILFNYIESFNKTVNEGLTVEQIKELKRIIEGDSDNESKKKSIFDKLLSFGSDVAANILANLITTPGLTAMLF